LGDIWPFSKDLPPGTPGRVSDREKGPTKMLIETKTVRACCPYCGEQITLIADCSIPRQVYVEDCEVCCRPISVEATTDEEGAVILSLLDENS
jgi:hypothetical protein